MKYELKRIAIWPAVKISFLVHLILGFVVGIFYALFFALLMSLPASMGDADLAALSAFSGALVVFLPFIVSISMAVFNTIFIVIGLVIFNFFTRIAGGLEFELAPLTETAPVAVARPMAPPLPTAAPPSPTEAPTAPHSPFSPPINTGEEPPQAPSL